MSDSHRPYGELRNFIESLDGTMIYQGKGKHGAWVISLNGITKVIPATGEQSFPDLDRLYVPKNVEPKTWNDRDKELLEDAEERLLELLTRD